MATFGNSSTPGPNSLGEGFNVGNQVAGVFTMPSPGGLITTLHAYAASFAGSCPCYLVLWDGSGNVLASADPGVNITTTAAWVQATLSSAVFVASGATIKIGWANRDNVSSNSGFTAVYTPSTGTFEWNFQGTVPGANTGGANTGLLGAYADYTPSEAWINTGTPASPVWTAGPVYVNTGTPASPTWTIASEVAVNTGTPASPTWTPGG